ncbi:MAG: protein-L-isoaspartate O-methyltransferase, partial [Phycisphaerae bacterium]
MSQNQRDWTTQARQMMVREQLQARCITDSRVLEVMGQLPRERFVPPAQHRSAYDDRALPIGFDQTISQPYMVAIMTEALRLQPNHRVLEVGTGSGYQTAVLARLASHVYTIERIQELADQALQRLEALGITNVSYRV